MSLNILAIHKSAQSGFTLLEVLISIVVLALGLLGLAALQITGLQNNVTAYNRSQAAAITYDIIDRIRANTDASGQYLTSFMSPTVATAQNACVTPAGCTPEQMAQNDLYEWQQALNGLPAGQGTVSLSNETYTVTIIWDENKDGVTSSSDPSFSAGFQL
jgi:type IV pilus assembly protein PilV